MQTQHLEFRGNGRIEFLKKLSDLLPNNKPSDQECFDQHEKNNTHKVFLLPDLNCSSNFGLIPLNRSDDRGEF